MTRLRAAWEYLRGTYWALPSAMAVAAVGLSVAMIQLDEAATANLLDRLSWVYTGGPEGARAVLSTVAGSMITVAGVTFSITIVALTLASQQFGPRLLRNFLRDVGNQVVIGTFISTFIYCLLVLRTVRGSDDEEFVPHLAVTVGVALAILSLGVLIFFIHHVATSIQATRVIANVADDLVRAIDRLFPASLGDASTTAEPFGTAPDELNGVKGGSREVQAPATGYVQAIDIQALDAIARQRNVTVWVRVRPGAFVRRGEALLAVGPAAHSHGDQDDTQLQEGFIIGRDRTGTQDVTFFIDQLVELAVRALSPGINDPGTARLCIDRLEQALCELARRQIPSPARHDEDGRVRVFACPLTFANILESALDEIVRYGRSSVSVTCRLLQAVGNVGGCVHRDCDRQALLRHATAIAREVRESTFSEVDRARVAQHFRATLTRLHVPPDEQLVAWGLPVSG